MYSMTMYSQNMLWEQENILRESRAFEDDGMYTVHTSDTYSFVLLGKTTWGIVAATWGKDCCVPCDKPLLLNLREHCMYTEGMCYMCYSCLQ